MDNKTLRLTFPQWQGGENPDYAFGSELLQYIIPKNSNNISREIPVDFDFNHKQKVENGVTSEKALLKQYDEAKKILEDIGPDKVITLGGDCSVTQAPFDYLNETYHGKLGVLWLDAHPDIATIEDSTHLHEMIVGNLIGHGAKQFSNKSRYLIPKENFLFAGLIEKDLRPKDQNVKNFSMEVIGPKDFTDSDNKIKEWITNNNIEFLAIHFDLDVLKPDDFRSILPAEPYLDEKEFGAAIGELSLNEVIDFIQKIEKQVGIVGFNITEHIPWDAINLNKGLSKLSIFK